MPSGVHSCMGSPSPQGLIKVDYYENGSTRCMSLTVLLGLRGGRRASTGVQFSYWGRELQVSHQEMKTLNRNSKGASTCHVEKKSRKHRSGPGTRKTLQTFQNFNNFLTSVSSLIFLLSFPSAQLLKHLKQKLSVCLVGEQTLITV